MRAVLRLQSFAPVPMAKVTLWQLTPEPRSSPVEFREERAFSYVSELHLRISADEAQENPLRGVAVHDSAELPKRPLPWKDEFTINMEDMDEERAKVELGRLSLSRQKQQEHFSIRLKGACQMALVKLVDPRLLRRRSVMSLCPLDLLSCFSVPKPDDTVSKADLLLNLLDTLVAPQWGCVSLWNTNAGLLHLKVGQSKMEQFHHVIQAHRNPEELLNS